MNRNLAAALIAVAAASSALADDITVDTTPFVSSRSRAEVQAELQQSRQSGVDVWAQDYDQLAAFHSSKSRAEVTAEYLQSRDQAAALVAEDSGSAWLSARAYSAPARLVARNAVAAE
jgi:hypothetical protein